MLNFPFYRTFPLDLYNRGIYRHLLSAKDKQRIFLRQPLIQITRISTFAVNLLPKSCNASVLFSYNCLPNEAMVYKN